MVKITLDAETFKALASSTRLTVLRALDERRKTLTELARDLDLNKATVHEHLQLLTAANLIRKRDDEGRKWIYYELTWQGQRLMHPQETTTFNVLLGLGVLAAGGGITMLGRSLGWWLSTQPSVADSGTERTQPFGTFDAQDPAAPSPGAAGTGGGQGETGTATTTSAAESGQQAPPAMDPAVQRDQQAEQAMPAVDDASDDGSILSVILLCMTALFAGLAMVLRRNIRPGRFNPRAAQAAEAAAPKALPSAGTTAGPDRPGKV